MEGSCWRRSAATFSTAAVLRGLQSAKLAWPRSKTCTKFITKRSLTSRRLVRRKPVPKKSPMTERTKKRARKWPSLCKARMWDGSFEIWAENWIRFPMELLNCAEKLPDGAQIKIDALVPPLKPESENNGYNLQLERSFAVRLWKLLGYCILIKDC